MRKLEIYSEKLQKKSRLWLFFYIYLFLLGFSLSQHELWGDEVHSWNIARGSNGLIDLISNTRYEGHPPLWYVILFTLSRFTHNPFSMQYVQFLISATCAFLILFSFKLRVSYKILIVFGYYFLYEYGVFSRNYSIGILLAFLITYLLTNELKHQKPLYYFLLLLLSNTHLLALLLAISFHAYYIVSVYRDEKKNFWIQCILGLLVLLPALYFIFPPSSSTLNIDFWIKIWSKDQLLIVIQAPLKALCPIPAWWEYHSWNTQVLVEAQKTIHLLKYLNPVLSLSFLSFCIYMLVPNKKVLLFFAVNLLLTLVFALIFPLTTGRYVGFIFIGFVIALFLHKEEVHLSKARRVVLIVLLSLQCIGAVVALNKDWKLPFSNVKKIPELMALVPRQDSIITDYWCLNYPSAYLDRPFYCLGFNREKSFLLWDKELKNISEQTTIYTSGIETYFNNHKTDQVYLLSNASKSALVLRDTLFFKTFHIELIGERVNAIEKYSDFYLYKIRKQ